MNGVLYGNALCSNSRSQVDNVAMADAVWCSNLNLRPFVYAYRKALTKEALRH